MCQWHQLSREFCLTAASQPIIAFFLRRTPAVLADSAGLEDDPVAGDEIGQRIGGDRTRHRPAGPGLAETGGQIPVGDEVACRDGQQGLPDVDLEIGALQQQM